jgi:hypothetical protein
MTTLSGAVAVDDFVWVTDRSRVHFGSSHTFSGSVAWGRQAWFSNGGGIDGNLDAIPGAGSWRVNSDSWGFVNGLLWADAHRTVDNDIEIWVRPDGDDDNHGMGNSARDALLTPHAAGLLAGAFNANGNSVSIRISDGTWSAPNTDDGVPVMGVPRRPKNCSWFSIIGNTGSPSSCVLRKSFPDGNYHWAAIMVIGGYGDWGQPKESIVVDEINGFRLELNSFDADWETVGLGLVNAKVWRLNNIQFRNVWTGVSLNKYSYVDWFDTITYYNSIKRGFGLDYYCGCHGTNVTIANSISGGNTFVEAERWSSWYVDNTTGDTYWNTAADSAYANQFSAIDADDDMPGHGGYDGDRTSWIYGDYTDNW